MYDIYVVQCDASHFQGLNCVLWILSVTLGFVVVIGVWPMRRYGYTIFESTLYACTFRIAWSLSLGWVIFSCVKGYGGMIDSFLSWGLFTSLSRLTYFTYLLHFDIVAIYFTRLTYNIEIDNLQIVSPFRF